MKNNKYVLVLLLCMAGLVNAYAQNKLAYIDENYIVSQLPEYKTVQAEMKVYEDRVKRELDAKQEEFKTKYDDLNAKINAKAPEVIINQKILEVQELEKQLQAMQQNIQQEYQTELGKRLQPIYEKMQKAVDELAVSNGNIFILRREALYFQVEENNLSDEVVKKLGATPSSPVSGRGTLKGSNKIGIFDVNKALPQLPAFKSAQNELQTYQKKLQEGIQKLQRDLQQIEQQAQVDGLPDAKRQELGKQYQAKQQEIAKAQQSAQEQYGKKQSDLLEPIYTQMQENINAVAKEQSYTYILKVEASLFEPASNNISNDVLKKMGVTPQE